MKTPIRSKTSTIDIYVKLAQYPVLADRIRMRMREEIFNKGIMLERMFEEEIHEKAIASQRREGVYDPFNREAASIWQMRKARLRDFQTDFYFGNNFPPQRFDEIVQEEIENNNPASDRVDLAFNPELAPWEMLFRQGEVYESIPESGRERVRHHLEEIRVVLIKGMISDHLQFIGVAKKVLSVKDLRTIYERRIGEGKIGGKAAGMMLAWRILKNKPELRDKVFIPESYFIGSEVIYDFRTQNNLSYIMNQKYRPLEEIRRDYPKVIEEHMKAKFPKYVTNQLKAVLEHMGNRPIIVRSSSLLEDNFGFSFAGKYESIFCPNQGTPEENLKDLKDGIRRIYASTLNPEAILYRQKHGLIDYDERMAILIQEVMGEGHGRYWFPTLAGVGFSQNAWRWHEKIKREDGFLRLVWGMGTRAVDRIGHDYARLIGLSHPQLRPEADTRRIKSYSQKFIDLVDLEDNEFKTIPIEEVLTRRYPHAGLFAEIDKGDYLQPILSKASIRPGDELILTFKKLLTDSVFPEMMKTALKSIESVYGLPVDTEFSIEVVRDGAAKDYRLNLLQCRPLSEKTVSQPAEIPTDIPQENMLFRTRGLVPDGQIDDIRYLVFVDPEVYRQTADPQIRLELGRVVTRINHMLENERFILMGPGRWGSTNLELGVKVGYADIHNTQALIEISISDEDGSAPELSYGTHFFQDLVEADIFSLPLHLNPEDSADSYFDWELFRNSPGSLATLLPDDAEHEEAGRLRVIDLQAITGKTASICMNGLADKAIGFLA
ncbi:MAG: PEP/pyruvate-binding domain-containing protein [Anaerolineae bacterium]